MKLFEFFQLPESKDQLDQNKLDSILINLSDMIIRGQQKQPGYFGLVAACVLDPEDRIVARLNIPSEEGTRIHAERAAMVAYYKKYGEIPKGSIIITTLSPCSDEMKDRAGASCTDMINNSPVSEVYCGYIDPTQHSHNNPKFSIKETNNPKIRAVCQQIASTFLDNATESFDIGMGQASHGKNGLSDGTEIENSRVNVEQFKEILKKFLPLAQKIVNIKNMPQIILKNTITHEDQPTMGRYHGGKNALEIAIANRQPVDILRTLAHELVHAKQESDNVLIDPTTGSSEENQANVIAGIVMRHFNKKYPEYLSFQPVEEGINNGRERICW